MKLRKINYIHTFSRQFKVDLLSTKWLSGKLKPFIIQKLKSFDVHDKVVKKWNTSISRSKA